MGRNDSSLSFFYPLYFYFFLLSQEGRPEPNAADASSVGSNETILDEDKYNVAIKVPFFPPASPYRLQLRYENLSAKKLLN